MAGREHALAQIVIVGACLDEAIAFDDGGVAEESGGLAVDHAHQEDEETPVKDDARHLGPQPAIPLEWVYRAPPGRGNPDEHAGADRGVPQDRGDEERPGAEDVEEAEPGEP